MSFRKIRLFDDEMKVEESENKLIDSINDDDPNSQSESITVTSANEENNEPINDNFYKFVEDIINRYLNKKNIKYIRKTEKITKNIVKKANISKKKQIKAKNIKKIDNVVPNFTWIYK